MTAHILVKLSCKPSTENLQLLADHLLNQNRMWSAPTAEGKMLAYVGKL